MLTRDFPGATELFRSIDAAVCQGCEQELVGALREVLSKAMRDPEMQLPECVTEVSSEGYLRRELYRSERHGYCVTAMTWAPHQGTGLHDHNGKWCVEGVWRGALEITQFECMEQRNDRARFEPRGTVTAGPGSAGSLIPPHEFHTIRNPSPDETAVSVHVYAAPLDCCSAFEPEGGDWYRCCARQLSSD